MKKSRLKIKVVSLFSGCGGSDLGLVGGFEFLGKKYRKLGFEVVWGNDIDRYAVETHKNNLGSYIVEGDISKISDDEIPDHDLLVGGFPCQPFSIVGQRKGFRDLRGLLYLQMVRILKAKKPAVFIAENVKGLVSINKGEILDKVINDFKQVGYKVSHEVLNAAFYGVPQKRKRLFIVGVRNDKKIKFSFPAPPNTIVPLGRVIEEHRAIKPKYYFSKRALKGLRRANKAFNKGRAQLLDQPCNTISTHLAKASLNSTDPVLLVRKNCYRRLTPREVARIQSFPDSFKFVGSDAKKYIQIGNAIPPVLMWYVAKAIKEQVFDGGRLFKKEKERDNVSHSLKEYSCRKEGVLVPATQ